jgi:hypothetical protein
VSGSEGGRRFPVARVHGGARASFVYSARRAMNRIRTMAAAAVAGAAFAVPAAAQEQGPPPPISLEIHAGKAASAGDWKDTADGRFSYGAAIRYAFLPFLSGYGGYDGNTFRIRPELLADSITGKVTDSGIRLGLDLHVPAIKRVPVQPFAEAGVILNTAKYEYTHTSTQLTDIFTSNFGVGYEAGGGVNLQILERFSVVPEVRYHTYKPSFDSQNSTYLSGLRISGWSMDLGVRYHP